MTAGRNKTNCAADLRTSSIICQTFSSHKKKKFPATESVSAELLHRNLNREPSIDRLDKFHPLNHLSKSPVFLALEH